MDLAEKVSIAKCCPEGKMRKSDNMGENTICASNKRSWQIPINGHLYNSTELWNKKKLVYDNRSLVSLYGRSILCFVTNYSVPELLIILN